MLLNRQRQAIGSSSNAHVDMTAMVDVMFQLMTYLLLTYQVAAEASVTMPPAKYGAGIEEADSVLLTVAPPTAAGTPAVVYDGPILDARKRLDTDEAIREAVERGLVVGKRRVIIQADAEVTHGDVLRVAGAAAQVPNISVHVGVEAPK